MDESESKGSLVGTIIVVMLLVAGAIYSFTSREDSAGKPINIGTTTIDEAGPATIIERVATTTATTTENATSSAATTTDESN